MIKTEEKGSDVNLAAHLLNDAWNGLFEVAAVISNDTDLVAPIRMVTMERKKVVHVVCPSRWQAAPKLVAVASHVRHIRQPMLRAAQ
ncbi:MAG: NYN domain-containing protein, partial [Chloroflexi bacterium]|nr:NYN domain-containing protein [Chloroflexota bacterium]